MPDPIDNIFEPLSPDPHIDRLLRDEFSRINRMVADLKDEAEVDRKSVV
jgi:hypothetical protein